jgi:aryl carrier-like protein
MLVYGLLGGRIAPEQTERWPVETPASRSDSYQPLRRYLAQSLPDYMIPAVFATVERIPLNANGKLDRSALPAIVGDSAAAPQGFVAPETPTERAVAALWTQVLQRETIGIHDNFFEVGGDSLAAIRLLSLVRREFDAGGTEMTLRFVFEHPTIRQMAAHIAARDQASLLMNASRALDLAGTRVVEGEL